MTNTQATAAPTAEAAAAFRAALADTLTRNYRMVAQLAAGVPEDAALRPLVPGGSHMNWLVGHLVANRDEMLRTMGRDPVRAEADDEAFGYGSDAAGAATRPLTEQLRDYDLANPPLQQAVAELTPGLLASSAGKRSVQERLAFLAWHETYHLGQLMLYRRAAGLESPIG